MQGLSLDFNSLNNELKLIVDTELCGDLIYEDVQSSITASDYSNFKIYDGSILEAIKTMKDERQVEAETTELEYIIGESIPTEIKIAISEDEMEAYITLIGAFGGRTPRLEDFQAALALNGVVRGISHKTLDKLIVEATKLSPGQELTKLLAKGLPPRKGKPSRMAPRVETLMERVLQPKENEDGSVDMRDFGEILSVTSGTVIAEIKAPTVGRDGYTVTHERVPGIIGNEKELTLGENTERDKEDPNIIRATMEGQPKLVDNVMTVQSVLTLKGVNVRTGNIKYKGSVLVTGDVADKMVIEAKGDVIVEGFVEAATIKTGGDIILSQGCSGPADTRDCKLIADGKITLQHGQGALIRAKGDINVVRQIAHCTIDAHGKVFVGRNNNANGSIFACKVIARNIIKAGNIGAVSGSKMEIDYSVGIDKYAKKQEHLQMLRENLASTNADHLIEYSKLNTPSNRAKAEAKIIELENALESEQLLLQWLIKLEKELSESLIKFKSKAQVIAMKTLYPNITVTMGDETLTTSKETMKNILRYHDETWKQHSFKG